MPGKLCIGDVALDGRVILAPMAGLSDPPMRRVLREAGAALTVGEMVAADAHLQQTDESVRRFCVDLEDPVPVTQILGADPEEMGRAARRAQESGARIVDVNFGCPARVVCGKACGAAIMRDETLAGEILCAVREVVTVAATVKMRLGWDAEHINAPALARLAQDIGFDAVTVHGRTREQRFSGEASYAVIREIARDLSIPVVANGDIDSPEKALAVLQDTGAAAVMVGRAAVGNPWLVAGMDAALRGKARQEETEPERARTLLRHWRLHRDYWNADLGALLKFRKHLRLYEKRFAPCRFFEHAMGLKSAMEFDSLIEGFVSGIGDVS